MPKPDTEWYKKISEGKKDYPLPLYAPWTAVYKGKFSNKDKETNRN